MTLPFSRFAALAAWLVVVSVSSIDADEPAAPVASAAIETGGTPAPVPAAPDLSAVPRTTLERLAADLALENLLLARGLAPARDADASADNADGPVAPELPTDPLRLDAAIAELEEHLLALRLHRAALAAASVEPDADDTEPYPTAPDPPDAAAAGPPPTDAEVRGTAEGSVPYRYRYSFGLIGFSGRGRVVVRDEHGTLRTEGYNFSEYRDDAVWVKLLFRNDGDTPQRFTGVVALGERRSGLSRPRVRMLATVSLSTPLLQPGEIHETDREVRVDRARDVDFVEVGRVRSFSVEK